MDTEKQQINQDIKFFNKYINNINKDIIEVQELILDILPKNKQDYIIFSDLLKFYVVEKKNAQNKIIELKIKKHNNRH